MDFIYSHVTGTAGERRLERCLGIVPGFLSLVLILGICVLSVLKPLAAAVVMVAFLLYWLLRLVYMNILLVLSYRRLAVERDADWIARIRALPGPVAARPRLDEIFHLVVLPVIRETEEVVGPGIESILGGDYPLKRFLVVIALEETASDRVKQDMKKIEAKYKGAFLDLLVVLHPAGRPGEARVKGANATFAAIEAERYFREHRIPIENVIVSCFDADTVAHPHYFSCLTYHFMINPDRLRSSYQPVPVYNNNIWTAPGFSRILDVGTSFFQLIEATDPGNLVPFSSHSMSMKALVEVGYWPVNMISDDSAIFWKAFVHYDGDYRVVPIYTTVSMDIATGPTFLTTVRNIYRQKRRWAWGVENLPIVLRAFLRSGAIPFSKKFVHTYKLFDSFISWSSWSFLLLLGSWLPSLFASKAFTSSTVFYITPRIRATLYSLSTVGLLVCMIISILLLPRSRMRHGFLIRVQHALEWCLIPVVMVLLSALPALDAQIRLMLGKNMEFWVTEKFRKK